MEEKRNLFDVFTEQDINDMWEMYKRIVNICDINIIKLHMMCEMVIEQRGLLRLKQKTMRWR